MSESPVAGGPSPTVVFDFALLIGGSVIDAICKLSPGRHDVERDHPPHVCDARRRLSDMFGEEVIAEYEKYLTGMFVSLSRAHLGDAKSSGKFGTVAELQAALTSELRKIVKELQRPRKPVYDDQGNLIRSEPA